MENKKTGIIIAILIILLIIFVGILIIIKPLNYSAIDIYEKGNEVVEDVTNSMNDMAIQAYNNIFTPYLDREIRAFDINILYSNATKQNIPVKYKDESLNINKIDSTKTYIAEGVYNKEGKIIQINIVDFNK